MIKLQISFPNIIFIFLLLSLCFCSEIEYLIKLKLQMKQFFSNASGNEIKLRLYHFSNLVLEMSKVYLKEDS